MNLLDTLLMSRKLKFEDGSIILYGDSVAILPLEGFIMYANKISNDKSATKMLYSTMRNSMLEQSHKLTVEAKNPDLSEWICDSINIYGYGKLRYEKPSSNKDMSMILEGSPFAKILKGKSFAPVDHILRGALAGIASIATGQELHAIETDCAVLSGENCRFILDSKEKLVNEFRELCEMQI
jgi:predicted hydrocarbon binding protein